MCVFADMHYRSNNQPSPSKRYRCWRIRCSVNLPLSPSLRERSWGTACVVSARVTSPMQIISYSLPSYPIEAWEWNEFDVARTACCCNNYVCAVLIWSWIIRAFLLLVVNCCTQQCMPMAECWWKSRPKLHYIIRTSSWTDHDVCNI